MADTIPASEFTRNFGRYRMLAQREAVAVSSHGSITGYFVAPDEYEEFRRFKPRRRSFATAELPEEQVQAIGSSRMDQRYADLNAVLEPKQRRRKVSSLRASEEKRSARSPDKPAGLRCSSSYVGKFG
jgi:hypothetical protein